MRAHLPYTTIRDAILTHPTVDSLSYSRTPRAFPQKALGLLLPCYSPEWQATRLPPRADRSVQGRRYFALTEISAGLTPLCEGISWEA
jgi:hypothetical protein